jgi:hypothetical protein
VTVEEHVVMGGAGSAVAEALAAAGLVGAAAARSACPTASSTTANRPSCCALEVGWTRGIERRVRERFADLLRPGRKLVVEPRRCLMVCAPLAGRPNRHRHTLPAPGPQTRGFSRFPFSRYPEFS